VKREPTYDTNFIGNVICWRRSTAVALVEHVAQVAGRHWIQAFAAAWRLSEMRSRDASSVTRAASTG
jgi:hypothetical protein